MSATAKEVAAWMVGELGRHDILDQQSAVYEIEKQFGTQFIYLNARGAPAIGKDVLREFRVLTENTVVWESGQRGWRKRQRHDEPGRRQH
jgi:hypothetical protein